VLHECITEKEKVPAEISSNYVSSYFKNLKKRKETQSKQKGEIIKNRNQ
jgi:hypothetical protein